MGFGYLVGAFGGAYNLQFSLGCEMKFQSIQYLV